MRTHFVVMAPPCFNDHLRLGAGSKPLEAQALVAEFAVEAFRDAILPGFAGLDQRRADALGVDPGQQGLGYELRAVVAAQEGRRTAHADQARQHVDHAWRADAAVDVDRQPLLGELVGHGEALELLAIGAMIEHEVVGPHLVGPARRLRPWPWTRRASWGACVAPVAPPLATAGRPVPRSSDARHGRERCGCAGSRTADIAPTAPASARSRPRPSPPCGPVAATPSAPPRTACRPVGPRDLARGHTQLDADEPARSPIFCRDFLHHLDLEVAFDDQLLQPRILRFELLEPPHVVRLEAAEPLAPTYRSSVR